MVIDAQTENSQKCHIFCRLHSRLSAILCASICVYVGGPDIVLAFHDVVWLSSSTPVVLTSGQSVAAGCETNPLIRAHGMEGRPLCVHTGVRSQVEINY